MKFGKYMSRIGKQPIKIIEGVEVTIKNRNILVKGPKGELSLDVPELLKVEKKEDQIIVTIEIQKKQSKASWGTFRALIQNLILGVTTGFEKKLEIRGIGYKANVESKDKIRIDVGYSHPIFMEIPEGLEVKVEKEIVTITGIGKQAVGQLAAKIRATRKPEPYKGKGIRYLGEKVRRKEGKKVVGSE